MYKWEFNNFSYTLVIDGVEACTLYEFDTGYSATACLDGRCDDIVLDADSVADAKEKAIEWYTKCLEKRVAVHKECLAKHEALLMQLSPAGPTKKNTEE